MDKDVYIEENPAYLAATQDGSTDHTYDSIPGNRLTKAKQ